MRVCRQPIRTMSGPAIQKTNKPGNLRARSRAVRVVADDEWANEQHKTIVVRWDRVRPRSVTRDETHLFAPGQVSANVIDNHFSYPTFTIMHAAGLAIGSGQRWHLRKPAWQGGL